MAPGDHSRAIQARKRKKNDREPSPALRDRDFRTSSLTPQRHHRINFERLASRNESRQAGYSREEEGSNRIAQWIPIAEAVQVLAQHRGEPSRKSQASG